MVADGVTTSTITVQLKDANNNNLISGGDTVALATDLGTMGSVTDNSDGSYTATLTSATTTGTATITGTLNAVAITDTATVTLTPGAADATTSLIATITGTLNAVAITDTATVTLTPGAADATTSLITATPTSIVADGVTTSTITVQLKDANNNNLVSGGDTVALATDLGTMGSVTDNSNGTYTATLTSATTTGTATITGTLNAVGMTDTATVTLTPGAADGTTSLITAAPSSIVADGAATSTITVQLKDAFNNDLTSGGDTVALATDLGSLGSVTDNSDGTYTATLTSTVTGTATITGTVNAVGITDTATVTLTPGAADATRSLITATPTSVVADGAATSTITVQLKDAFNNDLTSGGDTVAIGTNLGIMGSVTDNSDGTYTATLTSGTTTGTATITGTVNAVGITDTATVTLTPGAADATRSLITAVPTSIVADGASTSTITVQLKDAFNNSLTSGGDTVALAANLGGMSSVTDNGNGTYTATLTSGTTAGTATITGTVNAAAITDTATVTLLPGASDATTSLITAAPASIVADGVTTSTITVQLKDVNSNNLISGGDTVALVTDLGTMGSVTDNSDGSYTATLTSPTGPTRRR
jgi:adhesin/invasin